MAKNRGGGFTTKNRAAKMQKKSHIKNVKKIKKEPAKKRRIAYIRDQVKAQVGKTPGIATWLKELGPKYAPWAKEFMKHGIKNAKEVLTLNPDKLDKIIRNPQICVELKTELAGLKKRNKALVKKYEAAKQTKRAEKNKKEKERKKEKSKNEENEESEEGEGEGMDE
jgi:hypothetical protein|uniref:Uncharacterized protein n=1 Tax=Eutreptiella gymnastica TaxID=73025 RepID=A0A6T2AU23_9EUGL|eukprot:CAMPEP_0174380100 /NCGR_PEP_ID=MMETSP0811_2-20130205/123155_1 /TAXON_ID=73025 ORGANISM="Eutreptiella gymnastica-like, Strain CCMP1594" /NCGR_SAMPLE_ID=MMETSP0811_2 /ASSEMBLY_ACC=CAM_ASM_000667 /LENGTH=166 /DNA_ID=CAMNT_0015532865 /DNA_START=27 /DNA_END=527 /DNA_ORIENTATION=-